MSVVKGWDLETEPVRNVPSYCRRNEAGIPVEIWTRGEVAVPPDCTEKCYVQWYMNGVVTFHAVN